MCNKDIRDLAKSKGIPLWKIANGLGITDSTFSRKLRFELSNDTKEKIKTIINELSK
jgi:hypothetical protein